MSAKEHNFKWCDLCKQEVNFGEYQGHKRMDTKYQHGFLESMDHSTHVIKIKYVGGHTVIDRNKESVVHTCKGCKRSKGNIVGIKLDH